MLNPCNTTIILVHGFQTTAVFTGKIRPYNQDWSDQPIRCETGMHSDFDRLPDWLTEDGFSDIRFTCIPCNANRAPNIEECSASIRNQLVFVAKEDKEREIVIFAHSLGGLVVRAYLESDRYAQDIVELGRDFIHCVFTLGTPHRGMTFNMLLHLNLNCNAPQTNHPIAGEFSSTKAMKLFNLKYPFVSGIDYYTIGGVGYSGVLGNIVGTYIYLAWGPNDATVPVSSAIGMDGAKQVAFIQASHSSKVGRPAYFASHVNGNKSETYLYCVQPVLLENSSMKVEHLQRASPTLRWIPILPTALIFALLYLISFVRWTIRTFLGSMLSVSSRLKRLLG